MNFIIKSSSKDNLIIVMEGDEIYDTLLEYFACIVPQSNVSNPMWKIEEKQESEFHFIKFIQHWVT